MATYKTDYRAPSVTLINTIDSLAEAWRVSRPYLSESESAEVVRTELEGIDLPLNGMKHYHFSITSSLFFRDLLFTLRPLNSAWAMSLRTVKYTPETIFLSSEYQGTRDEHIIQGYMDICYDMISQGLAPDLVKDQLPMAVSTQYSISVDDRTLITWLKTLRNHSYDIYHTYAPLFLNAIGRSDEYVANYPSADIMNKLRISDKERELVGTTQSMGGYVMSAHELQANIMAQFVRQHYSVIHNELYNYLSPVEGEEFNTISTMKCDEIVTVAMYGEYDSWERVMSNRSGWFASMDFDGRAGWSTVVESFIKDLSPEEFRVFSRNANGTDPYKFEDALPRVYRLEPNLPNPFLIEDPSIIQMRIDQVGGGKASSVMKKWEEMRDAGIINDNPDNELRKIFWKCYNENLVYHPETSEFYDEETYKTKINPNFKN